MHLCGLQPPRKPRQEAWPWGRAAARMSHRPAGWTSPGLGQSSPLTQTRHAAYPLPCLPVSAIGRSNAPSPDPPAVLGATPGSQRFMSGTDSQPRHPTREDGPPPRPSRWPLPGHWLQHRLLLLSGNATPCCPRHSPQRPDTLGCAAWGRGEPPVAGGNPRGTGWRGGGPRSALGTRRPCESLAGLPPETLTRPCPRQLSPGEGLCAEAGCPPERQEEARR